MSRRILDWKQPRGVGTMTMLALVRESTSIPESTVRVMVSSSLLRYAAEDVGAVGSIAMVAGTWLERHQKSQ